MKKILAVVLSVVIVLCVGGVVFLTTSYKNDYKDNEIVIESTSGELISELVSDNKNDEESTDTSKKDESETKKPDDSDKNKSTKKNDESTKKDTTKKKEETTKETTKKPTTEAPKKREVKVHIYLPNKELRESKLTVKYKVEGSKDWKTFKFDDPDNKGKKIEYKTVILDGKTVIECSLGKFKGSCTVKCFLEGEDLSDNSGKLSKYDDLLELHPYSGIEIMIGEND